MGRGWKLAARGASAAVNDYIETQTRRILEGAAHMYDVDCRITLVGQAIACQPSIALAQTLARIAADSPYFTHIRTQDSNALGSEDATFFMQRVHNHGGQATYCLIGTTLAAGHHHERFDIDETSLAAGVDILIRAALALNASR